MNPPTLKGSAVALSILLVLVFYSFSPGRVEFLPALPNPAFLVGALVVAVLTRSATSIGPVHKQTAVHGAPLRWQQTRRRKTRGSVCRFFISFILIGLVSASCIALPFSSQTKAQVDLSTDGHLNSYTIQIEGIPAETPGKESFVGPEQPAREPQERAALPPQTPSPISDGEIDLGIVGSLVPSTVHNEGVLAKSPEAEPLAGPEQPAHKPQEQVALPPQTPSPAFDEGAETAMLALLNQERGRLGLSPLIWDPQIAAIARAHSQDMLVRGYFSHINPEGEAPWDRLRRGGVPFAMTGENIVQVPTVSLAHQYVMNSEGHRRNILSPAFSRIGIGIIDGGTGGKLFTQCFAD